MVKNLKFQKFKTAAAAILKNNKITIGRNWSGLVEIWHSKAVSLSWRVRPLNLKNKNKIKITAAAILKNPKLRYLSRGSRKFGTMT